MRCKRPQNVAAKHLAARFCTKQIDLNFSTIANTTVQYHTAYGKATVDHRHAFCYDVEYKIIDDNLQTSDEVSTRKN